MTWYYLRIHQNKGRIPWLKSKIKCLKKRRKNRFHHWGGIQRIPVKKLYMMEDLSLVLIDTGLGNWINWLMLTVEILCTRIMDKRYLECCLGLWPIWEVGHRSLKQLQHPEIMKQVSIFKIQAFNLVEYQREMRHHNRLMMEGWAAV